MEIPYCKNKDFTASNKIFEYLRCGLATIATKTSGQAEVLAECPGAGWLVPPEDPDALAQRLQSCVGTPQSLARAKDEALSAASSIWDWERYERILVKAVEAAL